MDIENYIEIEVDPSVGGETISTNVDKAGPPGLSAYEVAVKNGYVGTEEEWLASLQGEQGVQGETGATGPSGADGISPTATVEKSNGTATITITDKNGTTTALINDGANGLNGVDGRDGAIQYTAGTNITIDENNVISASGGDLSNYYTKTQINDRFKIYSIHLPNSQPTSVSVNDYGAISNFVNECTSNGDYEPLVAIKFSTYNQYNWPYELYYLNGSIFQTGSGNFSLTKIVKNTSSSNNDNVRFDYYRIKVIGTWTNGVFEATSTSVSSAYQEALSTTNTSSYTPTSDYHPATKKYVDDAITSAITTTLGGNY